jgi:hypothetical protein
MGFILYKKEGSRDAMRYTLVRHLSIVGKTGSFTAWLRSNAKKASPFQWELSGETLVNALAPDVDAATHAIVMDMMPEKLAGASLCNVVSLAGSSEFEETDLVISMREISLVEVPACGTDIRKSFVCDARNKTSGLIESMGVSGGIRGGSYRWCAPKMNIGAAVYQARPVKAQPVLSVAY